MMWNPPPTELLQVIGQLLIPRKKATKSKMWKKLQDHLHLRGFEDDGAILPREPRIPSAPYLPQYEMPNKSVLLETTDSMSLLQRRGSAYSEHPDLLVCDICLETYDDSKHEAKFLSCHHSFCAACLGQLAGTKGTIECPTCRQTTSLTETGISALQTNFYITYMRETFNKIGAPKIKGCQRHSNQPMSFFCQKCGKTICRDCTVLDHKEGDGHQIQDITAAEVEQRRSLGERMDGAKTALNHLQEHMQHLETEVGNLTINKETMLQEIEQSFDKYIKMLEYRKLELIKSVFDLYNKQQEKLVSRSEDLSSQLKTLHTMIGHCEKLVKAGSLSEVVGSNKTLTTTVDSVRGKIKDFKIGKNFMVFDAKAGKTTFADNVRQLGGVRVEGSLPSAVKFHTTEMTACLQAKVSVEVTSYEGQKLSEYPITVQAIDQANTVIQTDITTEDNGKYLAKFVPQMSGEHRLVTSFKGHPIKGAEIIVKVKGNNPAEKLGEEGNGSGKFKCPRAVVIDKEGNMFIADTGNRLIQKLDKDGKFLSQFYIDNERDDCSTCDLALNHNKSLIVCTETIIGPGVNPTMGNNVLVYTTDGEKKISFTNKAMKCALCVATNSHGEIIVSDYLVHSLFMYDENGTFVRRIGHAGTFNHPAFICIGEDDTVIVSDTNNDCVQVFDREGNFLYQFGSSGSGKGELRQPFGVATDGTYIMVVDSGNRRIQVFKKDGTFVSIIDSSEDPLDQPRGIAITGDGGIIVADRDNHCLKRFKFK